MKQQTHEQSFIPSLRQKVGDDVTPFLNEFETMSALLATISRGEVKSPPAEPEA